MKWTKSAPVVSGWYFTRTKSYGVSIRYLTVSRVGRVYDETHDYSIRIQTKHYEWAGPIEHPTDSDARPS